MPIKKNKEVKSMICKLQENDWVGNKQNTKMTDKEASPFSLQKARDLLMLQDF